MRIRTKKWAKPELAACKFFIQDPTEDKGKWQAVFSHIAPIHLDLGCGKGVFLAEIAKKHPAINYIGIDSSYNILGVARRNITQRFAENPVENIKITAFQIEKIHEVFSPDDIIERIYISFCNPWPKEKHKKRRLTHTRQLIKYAQFLPFGKEIYFKTDDDLLFFESIDYFTEAGFEITYKTFDLHKSNYEENILTEHEIKFLEQGIPIKFLIAKN